MKALIFNATCLLLPDHMLNADNKSIILGSAESMNKSKKATDGTLPARNKKITSSDNIHLLGLAGQADSNVPLWLEQVVI